MRLEGIDTLRGTAVVGVILYHWYVLWDLTDRPDFLYVHHLGLFGVSLFFIISGFLIYRSARSRIERLGLKEGLKAYAIHRFFRIVPAYYFNLFVVVILASIFLFGDGYLLSGGFFKQLLHHLTFTAYFVYKDAGFGINGAYWTLNIEMLWYLLAPLIVRYASTPLRLLSLIGIGFAYFYTIDSGLFPRLLGMADSDPAYTLKLFFLSFQLPGQILFFAAGILIYLYPPALLKRIRPSWGYLVLPLWLWLFCLYSAKQIGPVNFVTLNFGLLLFAATLFLLLYRLKLPLLHPLAWLGEISYSLYLWHMPLLFLFKPLSWPLWSKTLLFIVTLLAVSAASYYLIERWGFRFQKRLEDKNKV